MVDFIDFFLTFRLFDLEGGSKWSILLMFFNFSTYRLMRRVQILDFIVFFRLFDLGRVQIVDFIEFSDFLTF